jgi:glycoside/pentoside/hexuronide:cation symporter, GPH family
MKYKNNEVSTRDKIGYGIGDLGNSTAMQVVSSYFVFFMTAVLNMPGTIAGLAVGLSVFWDAFTDPIMGYVSDYTRSKHFGRRHLYILIGMIGVSTSILVLFNIPVAMTLTNKTILIFVFVIIYKTFMTMLLTPYAALGSELVKDYNERTRIQSIRAMFFMVGIVSTVALGMALFFRPTDEYSIGQLNPMAYRTMSIFFVSLIVVVTLITYFSTKKYIPRLNEFIIDKQQKQLNWKLFLELLAPLANKAFVAVAIAYALINMASAFVNSVGIHVFTYTFGFTSTLIASVLGIQMLFSILSQPLWIIVVKRKSKQFGILLGLMIALVGSLYFAVLVIFHHQIQGSLIHFIPYAVIVGTGTGALFTIPYAMISDSIDMDELKNGIRKEGSYFGCMTFFYKLSQAGAIFLIGILIDLVGFNPQLPVQSEATQLLLGLILIVGVIISFLAATYSILQFPLSKNETLEIQRQLSIIK